MSRRRFFQGHDAIYENFEFSRLPQLQGALEVFLTLSPEPAFHLQTLLVKTPDVESDQPAAVRANGHQPTASGEAGEGTGPQSRVADILEHHINAAAPGKAQDLFFKILAAVVYAEIGSQGHGSLDACVCTSASDNLGPQRLRCLYQTTAKATGSAHDQSLVAWFEVCQRTFTKGQGEVPRDYRRVRKG